MKTAEMDEGRTGHFEGCVHVQRRRNRVTRPTVSITHSFLGAYRTQGTDTITGQDCTVDWSGTGSSAPL